MKDSGLLVLRLGVGLIMALHGWPKIIGGPDMWEKVGQATALVGITFAPVAWGLAAALAEFAGGILTALGYFQRVSAFFVMITMCLATYVHVHKGDDFNVYSHALALAFVFLSLALSGAGQLSLDGKIRKKP